MPYGLPKGINSPEMNARMERCVDKLKKKHGKISAIKICKASLIKAHALENMSKGGN